MGGAPRARASALLAHLHVVILDATDAFVLGDSGVHDHRVVAEVGRVRVAVHVHSPLTGKRTEAKKRDATVRRNEQTERALFTHA